MGEDTGHLEVVTPGLMARINRATADERVKAQLEADLDAADRLKLRAELRLTIVIREAVKELADAQAKCAFARHKLETAFPPLGYDS